MKKAQDQMASLANFTKHLKKLTPMLSNSSKKAEEDGTLPTSFYEASLTQILKPEKDTTRKL